MAIWPIGQPICSDVGILTKIPRLLPPNSVSEKSLGNSKECRTIHPASLVAIIAGMHLESFLLLLMGYGTRQDELDTTTLGKPGVSL